MTLGETPDDSTGHTCPRVVLFKSVLFYGNGSVVIHVPPRTRPYCWPEHLGVNSLIFGASLIARTPYSFGFAWETWDGAKHLIV